MIKFLLLIPIVALILLVVSRLTPPKDVIGSRLRPFDKAKFNKLKLDENHRMGVTVH